MNCDVCGNEIDDQQNNYQAAEVGVVCESCCRKFIERARATAALKPAPAEDVDNLYTDLGGVD